jgi:hypothetical protein
LRFAQKLQGLNGRRFAQTPNWTVLEAEMRRPVLSVTIAALVVIGASWTMAAERATILLRSGERVSGELVDMGGSGFTVRVGGQERNIRRGDVAVIDFSGNADNFPSSELNALGGGGQAVVLSSGQVLQGRLVDISGSTPLKVTVDVASGGQREFRSNEIRRIYLARPASAGAGGGTAVTPPTTPGGASIAVPANMRWVNTNIRVRRGQTVTFNATGEIQLSGDPGDRATPAGSVRGRYPTGSGAMRNVLAGALVGRVGAAAFGIGNQTTPLTMPADGVLYLGVNDDTPADNRGEFRVTITPGPSVPSRR